MMPPRQRIPFQGGRGNGFYGPNMYGRAPMRPRMGNYYSPRMGGIPQATRARQGGGILSKILGGGNRAQGFGGVGGLGRAAAGNSGGSLLKSLTNPSSISGFLQNTQKILGTAQQIGPMVQQYGPLIKNLPAMWRLYRGLKNAPASNDESTNEVESTEIEDSLESSSETNEVPIAEKESKDKKTSGKKTKSTHKSRRPTTNQGRYKKGASKPKLYI